LGLPILLILAFVDPTEVNAEPRWIKPIKFFISIGLYNLTLEWIYRVFRTDQNGVQLNWIRRVIAVGMLVEAVLIVTQAGRGLQSHFNVATALDALIFMTMAVAITIVVLAVFFSGFLVWKARSLSPPMFAEAIIYGVLLMTLASFQGFVMTEATPQQVSAIERGEEPGIEGSHFVGEPPAVGHRTVPFAGWSLDVGDLRIAHFIGLHSLQFLLGLAFALHRLKVAAPLLIIRVSALLYSGLFVYAFLRAQAGLFLI
ncbi:MAG: hypothetical protein AAGF23_22540, partial [Acidobacteriota bacterium]